MVQPPMMVRAHTLKDLLKQTRCLPDKQGKDQGRCPCCAWFVPVCRGPGRKRLPVSGSERLSGWSSTRQGQDCRIL